MAEPMVYRRLRAPSEDGGVLLDPSREEISQLVSANLALRSDDVRIGERSLNHLRRSARRHLALAAAWYTAKYARLPGLNAWLPDEDVPLDEVEHIEWTWLKERIHDGRLYLVGHQPELFHPGVWLKNFALDALAKRDDATAVHVLIDNDEAQRPAIHVPTGSLAEPRIENVAFDVQTTARAWEECSLRDATTFRSFGIRVQEVIAPLVGDPLIASLWRNVETTLSSTTNLGHALAQLRHRCEIAWGVRTLEVPLSHVIDSLPFRTFTAHLLAEMPRFHEVHNAALNEYRDVHKLRSASQPIPNLMNHDDWFETPFWVWSSNDATRRKLLVKQARDGWMFADGLAGPNVWTFAFGQRNATIEMGSAIEALRDQGIKIRPRALVTTMLLRLLASDLFIHGIGGAKYDQVTDRIIAEFFGIKPPGFLTATGTKLLPLPQASAAPADVEQIDKQLRDLRFKPEEHVDFSTQTDGERARVERLIAEKRRWLRMEIAPEQLAERHAALASINAALTNYVSTRRDELTAERLRVEAELRRQAILGSREFSFCLYPEATLRPWLLDAAAHAL
jgi:hypothetical protein